MPEAPLLVWVRISLVLPPTRVGSGNVPLRVRQAGIDVAETVPGRLLAWHQSITGDWFAMTEFRVANRAGRAALTLTQLVPANAVTPREQV